MDGRPHFMSIMQRLSSLRVILLEVGRGKTLRVRRFRAVIFFLLLFAHCDLVGFLLLARWFVLLLAMNGAHVLTGYHFDCHCKVQAKLMKIYKQFDRI